ncbi:LysR family transcriptional regulator [Donghicola sp. C2-DW-16]|uniref:LysR family transcriptional regulator n=1 Tax=Donghicola mangrovi TaxID=2729614 RepID=A0ABX2PHY4_9RHOB|nr:LysR family transcriptional regulator [Donghicola mangrovi]NVO28790.1 LysR family transcriptional regulator [Donghicola mangrovi]
MENWNDLRICLALHRFGTMSAAADYLGANVATVSRRVHKLSEQMGEPLFTKKGVIWTATPYALEIISWAEQTEGRLARLSKASGCKRALLKVDAGLRASPVMGELALSMSRMQNGSVTLVGDNAALTDADLVMHLTTDSRDSGELVGLQVGTSRRAVWCGANFQTDIRDWVMLLDTRGDDRLHTALRHAYGAPKLSTDDGTAIAPLLKKAPYAAILPMDFAAHCGGLRLMGGFPTLEEEVYLYVPRVMINEPTVVAVIEAAKRAYDEEREVMVLPQRPVVRAG